MATLLQFSRNIRKLGSRIENNSVSLVKKVSKRTLRSLVKGTPVDEGVARSNWRASVGNPIRKQIEAHAPGKNLGIQETTNARVAISRGIFEINKLRVGKKRGTGQAGQAVFITNPIPYLTKLRLGSSKQQPRDWVQEAFLEASVEIGQTRLLQRPIGG